MGFVTMEKGERKREKESERNTEGVKRKRGKRGGFRHDAVRKMMRRQGEITAGGG